MQRACRLRKNRQFQYVYHKGKSCACRELVLLHVRNPRLQVGFSVSRKVGNSVMRNRVKRRLREQFRLMMPRLRTGLYVIVAREGAAKADSRALGAALHQMLRRQGLIREAEEGVPGGSPVRRPVSPNRAAVEAGVSPESPSAAPGRTNPRRPG